LEKNHRNGNAFPVFAGHSVSADLACSTPQPEFRPTATIKDIMDSIIDPSADEVWNSVSWIVEAAGSQDKYPRGGAA